MLKQVVQKIDGYHGVYETATGRLLKVKGTFALGPVLSWYDENGHWVVIDGIDQFTGKEVRREGY